MDPKHVRWFFYHHALSVRLMTLLFDGIWWCVTKGFFGLAGLGGNFFGFHLPIWFRVNESQRQLHTFIVGRTGVGKSVLLHNLIRHYLVWNKKPALVVFDPHGDLARSVVRDKAHAKNNRLVYINFNGIAGHHIHLNPFDLPKPTEHKLNRAQIQFSGAIEQIIGQSFTPIQRTLIRACLGIMLHKSDMNLMDLVRLLQDEQNDDLLHHGKENLPNKIDRQFFLTSFSNAHYRATKQALVARLTDIIRDPYVQRFTCQKSSLNLGQVLDSGKVLVVCFDPSKQSPDTIRTIGQLLSAAVLSHVLGRHPYKRHPIHLFVDECQYFVSPTIADILGESRKFGLYATLATQRIERLDTDLQDAILGNVGNIWIGASRHITADKMAKETELKAEQIRTLPHLVFYHIAGNIPARRQSIRFIGLRYAMSPNAWAKITRQQAKLYYQKPVKPKPLLSESANLWIPDFF